MKLLLFVTLFIGWASYYLCQRTVPSTFSALTPSNASQTGYDTSSMEAVMPLMGTEEIPFSKEYFGKLQSAFSIAYSTSFLVAGLLSDVMNMEVPFSLGLAASGMLLTIFPLISGNQLYGLVLYFVLGLSQGCGWPSVSKILRQTYRPHERAKPWSIMTTASSIVFLFSPFLVGFIIDNSSWQYSFYIFGITALFLTFPVFFIIHYLSGNSAHLNSNGDQSAIESDKYKIPDEPKLRLFTMKWFQMFLVFDLLYIIAIRCVLWVVKASVHDWGQSYLTERGGMTKEIAGLTIGGMQIGGLLGKLVMGYIVDFAMTSQGGGVFISGKARRTFVLLVNLLFLCVVVVLFGSFPSESNQAFVSIPFVVFSMGFFVEGAVMVAGLSSMDAVPQAVSGGSQSIVAASSQIIGRFLAGWPFSCSIYWIDWNMTFWVLSGVCFMAVVPCCFLLTSYHNQYIINQKKSK